MAVLNPGEVAWIEDPCYQQTRRVLTLAGVKIVPKPIDNQGIVIARSPREPLPRIIYVTPSHQFPLGVTMSFQRRTALLDFARAHNAFIFEDDYDAEFRFTGPPLPSLQGIDNASRVLYAGTVSKILCPGLRLGYIVAPRALIRELRAIRHAMVRHPSAFLQHAYALFLSLGHHESHARRVNHAMQERLALAAQALRAYLPDFGFNLPLGGASIWVRAPAWVDAAELALVARSFGVLIEAGDVFFAKPPYPCPFFRLRLSSIAAGQITAGIRALGLAVGELARARDEPRALASRSS